MTAKCEHRVHTCLAFSASSHTKPYGLSISPSMATLRSHHTITKPHHRPSLPSPNRSPAPSSKQRSKALYIDMHLHWNSDAELYVVFFAHNLIATTILLVAPPKQYFRLLQSYALHLGVGIPFVFHLESCFIYQHELALSCWRSVLTKSIYGANCVYHGLVSIAVQTNIGSLFRLFIRRVRGWR